MTIAGIIAEYNPFHTGHLRHLELTRAAGATHIAVVMSGSFVQRGEPAVCSKFARAKAAVLSGADLVVELPAACSLASARDFARGGVFLLHRLGAELLSFGSELGDASALRRAAGCIREAEASPQMDRFLAEGMSYPRARAAAVAALYGSEWSSLITGPNNLLGIEYGNAAAELAPDMSLFTIPRKGAGHDAPPAGGFASGSWLRELLCAGRLSEAADFLPPEMLRLYQEEAALLRAPVLTSRLDAAGLWKLRSMTAADFARLADVSAGLENRLASAAGQAASLADFCLRVKSKRHTLARLRRITCCALLDIPRQSSRSLPEYARILALNSRGREILAAAKKQGGIPIGANFADLARLSPVGLSADIHATDLFALAMPSPGPAGEDFTQKSPFYL